MKVKYARFLLLLLFVPALFLLQACPDDPDDPVDPDPKTEEEKKIEADPEYRTKDSLRSYYMNVYYYWRDEVMARNATLKPYDYDIYAFFDKMLHDDDRWSWMCDADYYLADETGVISGTWGVSIGQAVEGYGDYGLHVRYIYPGSPLEPFGVTRGAVLTRMDGFNVEDDADGFTAEKARYFNNNFYSKTTQTFTFRLADGRDTTFTATMKDKLQTSTDLITDIIRPDDFPGLSAPVGYFHYLAFKANFLGDIARSMTYLREQGVRDLIVDLRYNGGGDSRASDTLMTYLAPSSAVGKPYVVRHHNNYLASLDPSFTDAENTVSIGTNDQALRPDRIYFITGGGTASASEMVMNGLKPYMGEKMQMVGDTTYGKPNGMYVLMYPGSNRDYSAYNKGDFTRLKWVFLPIAFFNRNSQGVSIPLNGFIPDHYCADDLNHDFGPDEAAIRACLTHLSTGAWPEPPAARSASVPTRSAGPGCRIAVEEDSPTYGSYKVQKTDF